MELMLIRAVERLAVVGTGALSIYLGYLLFRAVKATGESDAQVKLPGDVAVMLTRVGPGVFFALFGSIVVGASLMYPVSHTDTLRTTSDGVERSTVMSGIGGDASAASGPSGSGSIAAAVRAGSSPEAAPALLETERLRVRRWIGLLNQLQDVSHATLSEDQRGRVNRDVVGAKLYIMKTVWANDWGSYDDFVTWAEEGGTPDAGRGFGTAAEFWGTGGRRQP